MFVRIAVEVLCPAHQINPTGTAMTPDHAPHKGGIALRFPSARLVAAVVDGAIPVKYKELIAVGVARKAGATDAELTEAAMVAAALRAGAAVTRATHALLS